MKQPTLYQTSGGVAIYKIPVQAFPGWIVNSYLIVDDEPGLIDPGTPFSVPDLESGFKAVGFRMEDVKRCIVTHGHFDHFMLAGYVKTKSGAAVYAHAADAASLVNPVEHHDDYHARFDRVALREGMPPAFLDKKNERERAREAQFIRLLEGADVAVDCPVTDKIGGWEVIHTPGHSPGHICMAVDDFLILGDHILSRTTPHQMPTDFGDGYGLKNYLDSLDKIKREAQIKRYHGLAGHEDDVPDVVSRACAIQHFHEHRLANVLGLCNKEKTAWEITNEYYLRLKELEGNEVDISGQESMAMTEILAHIEYLSRQGKLEPTERNGVKYYTA